MVDEASWSLHGGIPRVSSEDGLWLHAILRPTFTYTPTAYYLMAVPVGGYYTRYFIASELYRTDQPISWQQVSITYCAVSWKAPKVHISAEYKFIPCVSHSVEHFSSPALVLQ